MASYDYRDGGAQGHGMDLNAPGDGGGSARPMSRWVNLAGAATSLLMIAGLVVWGYKLAMRDLNGVPVIRAMDGPARIAPEDPGGELAQHTGLAVNAVAGTGQTGPAPDKVTLAPAPEGLAPDDLPMGEMASEIVAPDGPDIDQAGKAAATARTEAREVLIPPAIEMPGKLADATDPKPEPQPAPAEAQPVLPVQPAADSPAAPAPRPETVALAAQPDRIPDSVPGIKRSPRPLPKPQQDKLLAAALAQAVTQQMSAQDMEARVKEVAPADVASGTRLVQLGAFDSEDGARAAWDDAASKFPALMDGKSRVIQKASSGGRDFYRLRVLGFADVSEARQFCVALQAKKQNCIPTLSR